ncbi:type IV pilin protein [Microbulbifer sp. JTAC008]|uniref:type IV pilin protein n=1 Tax=unclassified Microbulbifer TaxID=2619833 RepID=UPI0040397031
MNKSSFSKSCGFTLIEVIIVVAIVGILAAIAYPSYMESVRKSNRSEAKAEMNDVAQRLQRCFTAFSSYDDANCTAASDISNGNTLATENNYYSISGVLTATTYTLTAMPQSGSVQAGDNDCASFTLTQAGVKGATGSSSDDCW